MNKGQPLLSVRGLNAWYGESHALHGVDLDIWPGETITLLGRNGVGKTTTLRAIMGIIRKRTGTITLDGKDIMRVPLHRIAYAGLGFVPEERGIFATLNVHENLLLPPVVAKGSQGAMSLDEIYELFPNLHERRSSPGTRSFRAASSRCWPLPASCAPGSGSAAGRADRRSCARHRAAHRRCAGGVEKRGMTVLLVEQNFRFAAKVADRFYLMDHGVVTENFPTAELPARMAALTHALGV